jgi:hypothetical protein
MTGTGVSRLALLVAAIWILLVGFFYYPKWQYPQTEATISWDVSGYYFYLPAIFIYHDLKQQKFKAAITKKYNPTPDPYQSYEHPSGNLVMKYSGGMALLYLPFFTIAHFLAPRLGYPADGFSFPYQLAIGLGSLLISLVGLYYLRKLLIRFFSETVTAICLLILVFSTNYLEYAAITPALTHNYLFTLYAILMLVTDNYYRDPKIRTAAGIGLLIGLMALIRPTEMLTVLIPVFWKTGSVKSLRNRIAFFNSHRAHIFYALLSAFIAGSLQLIYWKYVSGEWIVYSYGNEGFDFLRPHIIKCLFSFRKGWLIYTPAMIFAFAGACFILKKYRQFSFLLVFLFFFMYLNFSWQTWWYAGSLSQRCMVQAYPVVVFPLAAFITEVVNKKWLQIIFFPLLAVFTWYNLWLHHQAHKGGLLDPENMTRAYWQKVVLRNHVSPQVFKLLDTKEWYDGPVKDPKLVYAAPGNMELSKDKEFTEEKGLGVTNAKWIRLQGNVFFTEKEDNVWNMTQAVVRIYNNGEKVKENMIRLQRFINANQVTPFYFDVRMPVRADSLSFLFWGAGSKKQVNIAEVKLLVIK